MTNVADAGVRKLTLRRELCSGHARCHAVDPEMFPIDDEGYSTLETTAVADDRIDIAREGVHACPEVALAIED
ncbi:ferredoxin [Rhodococcus sp. 27YEA15]|uniref:ferredoxin n=1 Tax=Rhodococcus sp. 27YEA15 TaxID=3156259 RepID=UPI003C7D6B12